ncbi:MAG: dipeptide epimerase [Syntrophaceae bacterium]|nr:dipeptide epimerase [Syntrophaceae bacterium]
MSKETCIKRIEAFLISVPFKKTWEISLYRMETRNHAVVEVETESGIIGYGEVSPAPAFMGEDGRIIIQIINQILAPPLIGSDAFDLEALHQRMDRTLNGNGASKAAIDIAYHDLLGKITNLPTFQLLGGKVREEVTLSWVVGIQAPEKAVEEAQHYLSKGIKTIKVKIGGDPEKDIQVIRFMRERLGGQFKLRVDANQGYRSDQAIKILRQMESFDLESIEQPVPAYDIDGMRQVAEALDTPVMADESVFTLQDAFRIISSRAADIINIKVGKVGGLLPAKKIAALAESANIPCTIGSNLELGVGTSASLHLGISTPNVLYPCDLAIGPFLHQEEIIDPVFELTEGRLQPMKGPGLGVSLKKGLSK